MICQKCALCCQNLTIEVSFSDIARWHSENRKDILRQISFVDNYPKKGYGGFYVEKTLQKKDQAKKPCPFLLANNLCGIQETKPVVCRNFPLTSGKDSFCPNYDFKEISKLQRDLLKADERKDFYKLKSHYHWIMKILYWARK